jgi:DHA1 family inner membrane transport protein
MEAFDMVPSAVPAGASSDAAPPKRVYLLVLFALAMGGFAIGIGEFASMGLMPDIARGLSITEPQVGHLISAYALGVVVGAPVLAIFGAKLRRRTLLLALMAFYAAGNFASAMAPGYQAALVFRFIAGLPHGAYFGVAALVAASMSAPHRRAAAVSRVMLGLTVAMLIGNPLATWLGQVLNWRYAYGLVGAIALLTMVLVFFFLKPNPDEARQSPLRELKAFNQAQVWYALAIGAVGFAGMFSVFSYLAPTLVNVTRISEAWVPLAMAAFGLGGIIGNVAGGWLFDKLQFRAVLVMLVWSTVVLLVFPMATHALWTILPAVVAVGTMVGLSPALQTRLMDVASEAQTLAAASNHAAFNVANALGPWLGGLAIGAGLGWSVTGYMGAATAMAGMAIYFMAQRAEARGISATQTG